MPWAPDQDPSHGTAHPDDSSGSVRAVDPMRSEPRDPSAMDDGGPGSPAPMPLSTRLVTLVAVLLPLAGLIVGLAVTWGWGFSWLHFGILLGVYIASGLGITIGYHRLFTHKAFTTDRVTQSILAILGSMAVQGPLLRWVATHRCHHQHSDREHDPHSPHTHDCAGKFALLRGLWRAHIGWLFKPLSRDLERYIPDLRDNKLLRTLSALFPLWVLLGLLIPGLLGWAIGGSWLDGLLGVLWGGLVRILLVHHITWSINSVCHIWGTRPFKNRDESRNNAIFGVLAFGEGWHNNHHAFPTSARHGLRWWELDVSFIIIWMMSKLRLASNVRLPSPSRVAAKRGAS